MQYFCKNFENPMKPIASIITLLLLGMGLTCHAGEKHPPEYPRADIKVGYNYHKIFLRGSDGVIETDIPFVLLANSAESKFYCPSTEYKDSLNSTPSGRALADRMFKAAMTKYIDTKDRAAMDGVVYKTQLYVFKSRTSGEFTVYDYVGMTGNFYYREPVEELAWEISDSIRTILGYEAVMAEADYHGRHWTVWFAPEIPVQDGPWKLHGLPGLILEASEESGQHHFSAVGIEMSDKEIVPIYNKGKYEKSTRIDMLRSERYSRQNGKAMISAELGLDLGPDSPETEESRVYDYLETDYHNDL